MHEFSKGESSVIKIHRGPDRWKEKQTCLDTVGGIFKFQREREKKYHRLISRSKPDTSCVINPLGSWVEDLGNSSQAYFIIFGVILADKAYNLQKQNTINRSYLCHVEILNKILANIKLSLSDKKIKFSNIGKERYLLVEKSLILD